MTGLSAREASRILARAAMPLSLIVESRQGMGQRAGRPSGGGASSTASAEGATSAEDAASTESRPPADAASVDAALDAFVRTASGASGRIEGVGELHAALVALGLDTRIGRAQVAATLSRW